MNDQPKTTADAKAMAVTKNLVTKLCEVVAATERVPKNGWNDFHKYKFAMESDIVESIRGELSKRNVFIFPNITAHNRVAKEGEKGGYLTDINVLWTFVDGDSGEERVISVPGCGEDKGDKGLYKAFTGSEKYMLTKSFLIPTGDDPENDGEAALGKAIDEAARRRDQGREYKLNPAPAAPMAQAPADSSDSQQTGRVTIRQSDDGGSWFVTLDEFGKKGSGNTIWTKNADLAESLTKEQGTMVRAHLRSKKKGSYQLISYIPEEDPSND